MEPLILHIETSTRTCSIALSRGTECIAFEEDHQGEHTAVINAIIRKVISQAGIALSDLDVIAANEGPGSYTALRIGVVSAKALAFTLNKPLILVSGLDIIAREAKRQYPTATSYITMLDAGRDEVYMAIYDLSLNRLQEPFAEKLRNDMSWLSDVDVNQLVIVGSGVKKWDEFVNERQPHKLDIMCSSKLMIPIVIMRFEAKQYTEVALAKPFYLKLPHITTPKEKLITR